MKKLNNSGFVLAETLVVTVFIMTIFTILYNNFFPLIGEYEKREHYDDIDSKYKVYWLKNFLQNPNYRFNLIEGSIKGEQAYYYFSSSTKSSDSFCDKFADAAKPQKELCIEYWKDAEISRVYVTNYNITKFKSKIGDEDGFTDYINYLPNYKNPSLNGAPYRVIAEFKSKIDSNDATSGEDDYYYSYATIEVIR